MDLVVPYMGDRNGGERLADFHDGDDITLWSVERRLVTGFVRSIRGIRRTTLRQQLPFIINVLLTPCRVGRG